jgi:hypothetical protein
MLATCSCRLVERPVGASSVPAAMPMAPSPGLRKKRLEPHSAQKPRSADSDANHLRPRCSRSVKASSVQPVYAP